MSTLLKQILELILFSKDGEQGLALMPEFTRDEQSARKSLGEFLPPEHLLPENCRIQSLPDGENFINAFRETVAQGCPKNLFMLPPYMGYRNISTKLSREFPTWSLEEIVLKAAVDNLPVGTLFGILLPLTSFTSNKNAKTREAVLQLASPRYLITQDSSSHFSIGLPILTQLLILETGFGLPPLLKFFRYSESDIEENQLEIIEDLRVLSKRGGGKTKYGYVVREEIPASEPLYYEKYQPDFLEKYRELAKFGSLGKLQDLCEVHPGLSRLKDEITVSEGSSSEGIPLIQGADILNDGTLNCSDTQYKVQAPLDKLLQPGDICFRKVTKASRIPFVEIQQEMLPLAASDKVLILRLNSSVTSEDRDFILAYLRSEQPLEWLKVYSSKMRDDILLSPQTLLELPIPLPDEDLRTAIKSLNEAAKQFNDWKIEAEKARSNLFKFTSAQDARLHLLSIGRSARQRQEAAKLIDDFDYRVRTRFPHPVAYRWRTVKSSYADLEGYAGVLECAEVSICYLAHIAIVLAQHKGIPIQHVSKEISERLTKKQHGTNFGDWVSILRQIRDSKEFRALTGHIPFYEVLKFLETEADSALQRLSKGRNDLAHNRGPKGSDIPKAYKTALEDLEVLLKSAEFVSEYPLRYIEETKRDSIKKVTSYSYRDLMGDHPLVPIQTGQTSEPELEAGSLYLIDRDEKLYLLRPLLSRRLCPECGVWATFYLDSYRKNGDITILKSMEHGHTAEDAEVTSIFKDRGILSS